MLFGQENILRNKVDRVTENDVCIFTDKTSVCLILMCKNIVLRTHIVNVVHVNGMVVRGNVRVSKLEF